MPETPPTQAMEQALPAFEDVTNESPVLTESTTESTEVTPEIPDTTHLINYGPNYKVELELGSPLKEKLKGSFDLTQDYLNIPSIAMSEFGPVTNTYRNERLPDNDDTRRWRQAAAATPNLYVTGDAFTECFDREDAQWQQSMSVGTEHVRADRPKFTEPSGNRVSGEEARLRIRAALSAGSRTRVPLWHSGLWVTIKAPTEAALLELDSRIANEKVELGRASNGLVYSSMGVYLASMVVDFIFDHISETSYQGPVEDLRDLILQPDYQQLVWGMLCSIYTDGYTYQQPCLANPFNCLHVETARLNFGKMSFVDDRAFSDFQRQHMRKRKTGSHPKIDIERYQSEHKFQKNAVVKLHDRLAMELKVPTIAEYEASGRNWVSSTVEAVDTVFGKDASPEERNAAIARQADITILQQYSHWVKLISLTEDDKHVEDRETIQETLADLTSDDDVFKRFFEGIKLYMTSIMVNVHGIPKYPCPSCGETPSDDILKHPMIFPIDLVETFFTLAVQRIRRILARRMT